MAAIPGAKFVPRWVQRNEEHGAYLAERFDEKLIPHDLPLTHRVAVSLYGLAEAEGADLWVSKGEWMAVEPGWRKALVSAAS